MNARRFSLEPTTSLSVRKLVSWLAIPAILGILGGCAYYPYGYYQSGYTSSVYAAPGEYTYFDLQPGYAQYYSPPLYAQYMLWYYYPRQYYQYYPAPPPPLPRGAPLPRRPPYGSPPPPPGTFFQRFGQRPTQPDFRPGRPDFENRRPDRPLMQGFPNAQRPVAPPDRYQGQLVPRERPQNFAQRPGSAAEQRRPDAGREQDQRHPQRRRGPQDRQDGHP
ncbi:hypothetical protein MQE22_07145 [Acidithiobacillus sp. YTS05]|uniref:hypothetical protein n=1 Tax=Igneacidithiobacillus copahuensis TaxID=2724909 RepID=UPI001C06B828|nr:hypothetical protein [Igneacidithiobacillus copahuensis]UTV79812.1 hypothetical protein MQE22_07145 [Acidithiobacillus sp. YTS05]